MFHFFELFGNFDRTVLVSLILISLIIPCEQQSSGNYCRGRADGKYADSKDCYHYFQCFGGISFMSKCPRGHVFDRISLKCETSVDIPCNATKTQKSMVGTKCSVEGEIKPSAVFCERFLVCRNGYNYPIYCPPRLIFSNKAYECILAPDPCATDPASKNKKKANDLIKRKKSPYIGICDDKISRNISEPLHCTMYIQCMMNQTTNTTIVLISACETGLLYSNETNQCEKPAVVLCGQRFRNKHIHGSEPKPKEVFRFLAEKNGVNAIGGPIAKTTTAEPETTRLPVSPFGRGLLGVGGAEDGNPDSISSLDNPLRRNHRIVLHDYGAKNNDSSESFLVKIILSSQRNIGKTSILGNNGSHNHIVIEDQSMEEKSATGGVSSAKATGVYGHTDWAPPVVVPKPQTPVDKIAPGKATTESEYEDDTTTIQSLRKMPTTTEEEFEDDTTLTPMNAGNDSKVPAKVPPNAGIDSKVPAIVVNATKPGKWETTTEKASNAVKTINTRIPETKDYESDTNYDYYKPDGETDGEDWISDSIESRNGHHPKSTRTLPPKKKTKT